MGVDGSDVGVIKCESLLFVGESVGESVGKSGGKSGLGGGRGVVDYWGSGEYWSVEGWSGVPIGPGVGGGWCGIFPGALYFRGGLLDIGGSRIFFEEFFCWISEGGRFVGESAGGVEECVQDRKVPYSGMEFRVDGLRSGRHFESRSKANGQKNTAKHANKSNLRQEQLR